jgi:hypothetical protein
LWRRVLTGTGRSRQRHEGSIHVHDVKRRGGSTDVQDVTIVNMLGDLQRLADLLLLAL